MKRVGKGRYMMKGDVKRESDDDYCRVCAPLELYKNLESPFSNCVLLCSESVSTRPGKRSLKSRCTLICLMSSLLSAPACSFRQFLLNTPSSLQVSVAAFPFDVSAALFEEYRCQADGSERRSAAQS